MGPCFPGRRWPALPAYLVNVTSCVECGAFESCCCRVAEDYEPSAQAGPFSEVA